MSTFSPNWIDSFGHSYFTITLGAGLYSEVNGSPTTSTTVIRGQGSRSLVIDAAAAENFGLYYAAGLRIHAHMFYIRFETLPVDNQVIFRFTNANGNGDFGFDATANQFYVKAGGASTVTGGPKIVKDDKWYRVVLEYDTSTGTATLRANVESVEWSGTNTQTAADITQVNLGRISAVGNNVTYYINSYAASSTDGDYETMTSWAQHDVQDLHPISDGTHNINASGDYDSDTTNAFSNSSTDVYTYLDQAPFNGTPTADDNVRNDVKTAGSYVEVNLTNPTILETVDGVRGIVGGVDDAGFGDSQAEARLFQSGGTEITCRSGLHLLDSSTDHFGTLPQWKHLMMDKPGGTWDTSEVANMYMRLGYATGAPIPHWHDVMVEVLSHQEGGEVKVITVVTER